MSLSEQDIAAIKHTYDKMMQCFLNSDWMGYASAYTDDALFLAPEGDIFQTQGQQSLADWTARMMQDYGIERVEVADGVERVEGDGACAYLYTLETREKIKLSGNEEMLEFKGNSVSVFARQSDGSWKIKLQVWNKQAIV
jgi:uncharacterized protein (TIGR02246 family)